MKLKDLHKLVLKFPTQCWKEMKETKGNLNTTHPRQNLISLEHQFANMGDDSFPDLLQLQTAVVSIKDTGFV